MPEMVKHPESELEIEGRVLPPGSDLEATDMYASTCGKWLSNPVGAAKVIDNDVIWVRPFDEKHENRLQRERRERNRIMDERCTCQVGAMTDRGSGVSMMPPQRVPSDECPLQHESTILAIFFHLEEINRRWPYKEEPPEMKYPDGVPK